MREMVTPELLDVAAAEGMCGIGLLILEEVVLVFETTLVTVTFGVLEKNDKNKSVKCGLVKTNHCQYTLVKNNEKF